MSDENLHDQNKENNSIESPNLTNETISRKSFSTDAEDSTPNVDQHENDQLNHSFQGNSSEDRPSTPLEQIQSDGNLLQLEQNQSQHNQPEEEEEEESIDEDNSLQTSNENETTINNQFDLHPPNPPSPVEELKSQKELDEEIPPPILQTNRNEISSQENSTKLDSNEIHLNDEDRPLTKLEKSFEDEQIHLSSTNIQSEEQQQQEDKWENQSFSTDHQENKEILPPLCSTSLSMESNQFNENPSTDDSFSNENHQENNEILLPIIQLEKPSIEEIRSKDKQEEEEEEEENFPPLNCTSLAMEQINENHLMNDHLSFESSSLRTTTTNDQISIDQRKTNENENEIETNILPEAEDLLGNKTLMKQIVVKGKENSRPTRSTLVKISYQSYLVDQLTTENRLIEEIHEEEYFVSECDLIPSIDISIQSMNQGEKALIDCDLRHCYGDLGWKEKQIPPASSTNQHLRMKIHLELHQWNSARDVQSLSITERLHWGNKKRQMGNFYYQRQDYSNSLQSYRGALRFLDLELNPFSTSTLTNEEKTTIIDNLIQIENNIAQVNLNLTRYQSSLEACENVLKYDPKNVKALFRQGKAFFELGKYDQALQPLKLCLQLQRSNSSTHSDQQKIIEIISTCETKLANYQKKEKEIYRRMFQPTTNSSSSSSTNEQHRNRTSNQPTNSNASSQWLTYLALGSAALALIGIGIAYKYRKLS